MSHPDNPTHHLTDLPARSTADRPRRAVCPKCGQGFDRKPRYVHRILPDCKPLHCEGFREATPSDYPAVCQEHLHITCPCGYWWAEACKDADG